MIDACTTGRNPAQDTRRHAFTLIELLVVIAIIALLSGLIVSVMSYTRQASLRARAKARIERLHTAIEEYRIQKGSYPADLNDLAPLLPQGLTLDDPWDRPFVYKRETAKKYSLYSEGPKENFKPDDIYSGR